jgi:hypothetical protein
VMPPIAERVTSAGQPPSPVRLPPVSGTSGKTRVADAASRTRLRPTCAATRAGCASANPASVTCAGALGEAAAAVGPHRGGDLLHLAVGPREPHEQVRRALGPDAEVPEAVVAVHEERATENERHHQGRDETASDGEGARARPRLRAVQPKKHDGHDGIGLGARHGRDSSQHARGHGRTPASGRPGPPTAAP